MLIVYLFIFCEIYSVTHINCKIIEFLINKVLDVKPLVSFIIKDYAISLTNSGEEKLQKDKNCVL